MIIGLSGKAGSGKDSFADILVRQEGYTKLSFARNLKEMCKKVFGLTDYDVYDQEGKEKNFEFPHTLLSQDLFDIHRWVKEVTPGVKVSPLGLSNSIRLFVELKTTEFKSPRELLQFVGTEICRQCYSREYHIDVVKVQILNGKNVVIADARFENERNAITKWEGVNINVINPDQEESEVGLKGHASESAVDTGEFESVFINDKTQGLDSMAFKVTEIIKQIKETIFKSHGGNHGA